MNFPGAIIGGTVAGLFGAGLWAGIAYFTGYEIGWIAWGIGFIVGLGVVAGGRAPGLPAAAIAIAITVLSILLGKYASIELSINKELDEIVASLDTDFTQENLVSYLADEVVAQRQEEGEEVKWPEGVDPENAMVRADYAADIWQEATGRWTAMSVQEQDQYKSDTIEKAKQNISDVVGEMRGELAREGFMESFAAMDLLFFGLAVFTAFRVGAGGGDV